jgi:uncharacterized protein YndB with AHSA1/START domain
MGDRVERETVLPAPRELVWELVVSDGWLADSVRFELEPGGEASFASDDGDSRDGWVEEAVAPARLAFWWAQGDEPATRVEVVLDSLDDGASTRLHVVETRPLDVLDLVGTPLSQPGGGTFYGPALVAAGVR